MCDIWKANHNKQEISIEELGRHISSFKKLKVEEVALSGGEALMHSNFWRFCDLLREQGIRITLLSTGLLLEKNTENIVRCLDDVIVSLDGSRDVHNLIRNIPMAFEKLESGVKAIKKLNSDFSIKARCVLQKLNYRDLPNILTSAKAMNLEQISFLTADVSTAAFNRHEPLAKEKTADIVLTELECAEFKSILSLSFKTFEKEYQKKFIAESPAKMLTLWQYYAAIIGIEKFPQRKCNAPWVSAVVESDGEVRPCFFHEPYGNMFGNEFLEVVNSEKAVQFRKNLDMTTNPICQKCVCWLNR
jgi:MoaA/NifB/PqqE/SkfB family radical SAM enzyme